MLKVGIVGRFFCTHKHTDIVRSYYRGVRGTNGRIKVLIKRCKDCGKEWEIYVNGD